MYSYCLYKRAQPLLIFPCLPYHQPTDFKFYLIHLIQIYLYHRHSHASSISLKSIHSLTHPRLIPPTSPHAPLPHQPSTSTMGSFTKIYMSATFPESSGLDSVGSVAANFSRTEEEEERIEFQRFSCGSAHVSPPPPAQIPFAIKTLSIIQLKTPGFIIQADLIRGMHGIAAHESFLEETRLKNEADAMQLAKQRARRRARSAAVKRVCCRLTALFVKLSA